jgi:hypothetical protein
MSVVPGAAGAAGGQRCEVLARGDRIGEVGGREERDERFRLRIHAGMVGVSGGRIARQPSVLQPDPRNDRRLRVGLASSLTSTQRMPVDVSEGGREAR